MAQILNLNRARKAKLRKDKEQRAAENRIKHGTPKSQRARKAAERAIEERRLEGHKRRPGSDDAE